MLLVPLLASSLSAQHIFPARDVTEQGDPISWYGSRAVFVGPYTWPDNEPLGLYNDGTPLTSKGLPAEIYGNKLVPRADFSISGCDTAANTCRTDSYLLAGGLPDGTEVKLVTTGTLPGGLISWQQDHAKVYYIKDWSGRSFQLSNTPGGPTVQLDERIHGSGIHGMSFAGYMHVMVFHAAKAVPFSCDPDTDICTTERPHKLLDNAPFYVYSTGKLPGGLAVALAGEYMPYCIDYVSPTQFKVRVPSSPENGCSSNLPVLDITSKGEGTHYLYAVYIPGLSVPGASRSNAPIEIQSIQGYPRGTVFSWRFEQSVMLPAATSGGLSQRDSSGFCVAMFAKVPAVTPPGQYRITVHTSEDRARNLHPNSFQYTLDAVELPKTPTSGPSSYPPIPGLKKWETVMVSAKDGGGADGTSTPYPRCPNRKDPDAPLGWVRPDGSVTMQDTGVPYPVEYNLGGNQRVWYYNDETFFKIAKYTNDPTWASCGIYIAKAMRNQFLLKSPKTFAFLYFPWQLVAAYQWTHDPSYKEAVIRIADEGAAYFGWLCDAEMREHAYAFERRLARLAVTGEVDYNLQYFAEGTLATLYGNATGAPDRSFNQPFMLGLAMRPLIRWYMMSHDQRIPYVLKLTLDRFWDQWYDQKAHHYAANPEPEGERCTSACQKYTGSILNNLVSPAFAWYWRLTGDDIYRVRGDDLFSHEYAEENPWSGKEWSLSFYWSWDYVAWREGKQPAY
jgi:hypothetical protein